MNGKYRNLVKMSNPKIDTVNAKLLAIMDCGTK